MHQIELRQKEIQLKLYVNNVLFYIILLYETSKYLFIIQLKKSSVLKIFLEISLRVTEYANK